MVAALAAGVLWWLPVRDALDVVVPLLAPLLLRALRAAVQVVALHVFLVPLLVYLTATPVLVQAVGVVALLRVGVHRVARTGYKGHMARTLHVPAFRVVLVVQLLANAFAVSTPPFLRMVVVRSPVLYLRPRVA